MIERLDIVAKVPHELGQSYTRTLMLRQVPIVAKINEIIDVINTHVHPNPFNERLISDAEIEAFRDFFKTIQGDN